MAEERLNWKSNDGDKKWYPK